MQSQVIDEMVWRALTNTRFREGLLNGRRRELVAHFDLTDLERTAVMAVQADSLQTFAAALDCYVPASSAPPVVALMPQGVAGGRRSLGGVVAQGML